MNLRKLTSFGVAAVMALAIAAPVFAQGNENNDFQAIQDERDQRKLVSLIENFISKYSNSQHRPDVDIQLMTYYYGNKDWQLMMKHADSFAINQGAADAKSKSKLFTLAMEAARQLKNNTKFNEFADKALAADPNNMSVLMTMTATIMGDAPADAAARTTAMDKALGYAQKAQKVSKPEASSEGEWAGVQNRLHGYLGVIYFNKNQFAEATPEIAEYLKMSPTDGLAQFRYGYAMFDQLKTTLSKLNETNTEAQAEQKKGADASDVKLKVYSDRLTELSKEFETKRDMIIDAMANALAIGGAFAANADQIFDPLFKQKTNSLDGKPAYIAEKKAQLTALVSAAAAPAAGAPGAGAFGGGFTGGAGAGAGTRR